MGGKGSNQSIALAHAGAAVFHAGKLGKDGVWLKERLQQHGVDTTFVDITDTPSGHAIIQVNKDGENAIVLFGGANQAITGEDAARVLGHFAKDDYLLLQNEISAVPEIMSEAARRGLRIVFNPAPMCPAVLEYPLKLVHCFIVNEIEGGELSGEREPERILAAMRRRFPQAMIVLTLGAEGALCAHDGATVRVPAVKVVAVDTTAAGDTFIGFFLAGVAEGLPVERAIDLGCRAAAISVTRPGAMDSIPSRQDVDAFRP
jgi:ribokinase